MKPSETQRPLLLALASVVLSSAVAAQHDYPVLRSSSNVVTIIDGDHVKGNYWTLMPERNPDVYYVEIPMKPHTVTFRSDIGELSIPVTFGDRVDFVILLNDKVACPTQVRAEFRKLQPFSREARALPTAAVTIPFTLGDNDKIYIKGRLNEGKTLDFQFDLGCGGSIIKERSVASANMQFDGVVNLTNSDGVNEAPSSSANHLEVAGLHWHDLPFVVADNMTHREDGLLGNTLFQGKVVEINYDRGLIVVRDALPAIDSSYSKHAIVLDGVVPFIRGSLAIGDEQREGWFMFDTGAYTSILYSDQASPWDKLLAELRSIFWRSEESSEPRLTIGDHALAGFNYSVRNDARNDDQLGLLGNDLLKRFNVILDNQNGFIYLQPNTLAGDAYDNPEYYLARGVVAAGVVLVIACGLIVRRVRKGARTRRQVPWTPDGNQ